MKLAKNEQETLISQDALNRDEWIIYTDDPVKIREFKKKALEVKDRTDVGYFFILPDKQLTIRKKRTVLKPYKIDANERKRRSSQMKGFNS